MPLHAPGPPSLPALVLALSALVAGASAVGGYLVNERHESTVRHLEQKIRPAQGALAQARTAVGDARSACLAEDGAQADALRTDARTRLAQRLPELRALTAYQPQLAAVAQEFDRTTTDWLDGLPAADRAAALAACSGSGSASGGASGSGSGGASGSGAVGAGAEAGEGYPAVHRNADRLTVLLAAEAHDTTADATREGRAVLFYLLVLCGGLVVLAGLTARQITRRLLAPLAGIEQRLRHDAPALDVPAPAAVSRLAHAADALRTRLRTAQRQAHRDHQALVQNGPCVQGLGAILASRHRAGPGVRAHGDLVAAEGLLAGDYLGVIALPDGSTALLLGDVSGHGVEAALLAVQLKCALRGALRTAADPVAAVRAAWHTLDPEDEHFTTLVLARIDPRTGRLSWLNAGHERPFLRRADGTVERLAPTGPLLHPLIEPGPGTWSEHSTPFHPGDLLLLCTDGLTEGRGPGGEFGEQRVADLLAALPERTPDAAVRALHAEADRFGLDWRRDDVTALAATVS
ncbi:PP2C family protein-serine/threonine phosphatase [Kitasatospora phosalacinea]|uniref:PP2C family protein-serine/threonine phosphatase n=1 Tax=Kitasatospora phosalacinea TaxID=2065 RepID=A0ABW6GLF4_9ACTN